MKLSKVKVTEFQSIIDSNEFEVGDITCLVGKNEAGKTAITGEFLHQDYTITQSFFLNFSPLVIKQTFHRITIAKEDQIINITC